MRTIRLTVTMLLIGAAAEAQGTPPMPLDVGPGRVAWFDISTSDLARAREFYGKLFEWTFTQVADTGQAVEIHSRGMAIGTLRGAEGPISKYNGVVYVQVDDVQRASDRAKELGATVPDGFPFNLPDGRGAISVILDPSGHPLGLYSRARLPR
jgi:predicted enzyme related to lactoylglutathione lyase